MRSARKVLKKLSAVRAVLSNQEREVLDAIVLGKAAPLETSGTIQVKAHSLNPEAVGKSKGEGLTMLTTKAIGKAAGKTAGKVQVKAHKFSGKSIGKAAGKAAGKTQVKAHKFSGKSIGKAAGKAADKTHVSGFVGLLVPHLARLVWGHRHRALLPAAFVGGGTLLTLADTLARTVVAPRELPVGFVTALVGVPVFALLLRRWGSP